MAGEQTKGKVPAISIDAFRTDGPVEQALRESEERLRAIFDNAGVGLVEVAADDRIMAANDRLYQILGYERLNSWER